MGGAQISKTAGGDGVGQRLACWPSSSIPSSTSVAPEEKEEVGDFPGLAVGLFWWWIFSYLLMSSSTSSPVRREMMPATKARKSAPTAT